CSSALMHRDPSRKWTLAGLARTANVSRATLARRFTALAGQPPLAYLTWWRMTCAARRLRATDAPLAAIASSCGHSSEFAFAKAFKREFGMAPGSYRQRGRAGADACPGGPHSAVPPARPSPFDSGRLPWRVSDSDRWRSLGGPVDCSPTGEWDHAGGHHEGPSGTSLTKTIAS